MPKVTFISHASKCQLHKLHQGTSSKDGCSYKVFTPKFTNFPDHAFQNSKTKSDRLFTFNSPHVIMYVHPPLQSPGAKELHYFIIIHIKAKYEAI